MAAELVVVVVMEAFDSGVLDRAVHPLDPAIGPRVVWLFEAVLDPVGLTDHVEAHWPGIDGVAVSRLHCELNAVVGENGVDVVGHCVEHVLQKLPRRPPVRLFNEFGHGELSGAVDADKEIELIFCRLHLGNIDVEEPNRVALELLTPQLVPLDIRQARDAVPLQAPVQCRARQVRDRRLPGIETVVQRQLRMTPECAIAASSASVRTVERGSFGPVLTSSTGAGFRHLATVFGIMPSSLLSAESEACDRCIAALTANVVVALP